MSDEGPCMNVQKGTVQSGRRKRTTNKHTAGVRRFCKISRVNLDLMSDIPVGVAVRVFRLFLFVLCFGRDPFETLRVPACRI